MQKIIAIAWLTWKAALRFQLFLVIAVLLLAAVVGLPILIKDDGTARGFTQILLTYTLSAITGLLGFSTLWLACGTLARDIEECQMQVVATKPIARWQIWLGKWLGIMTLNAALLAISGISVYALLQWRATRLPADQQQVLRNEVLVARGSAKEPTAERDRNIQEEADRLLKQRLKSSPVTRADLNEVRRQILEQVKAVYQVVPPGYVKTWEVPVGLSRRLDNSPLYIRIKFNTAQVGASGTFVGMWQVGTPAPGHPPLSLEPMSLAPDTFHEFEVPSSLIDDKGNLAVSFFNSNPTTLLFPLNEGMEVLYREGGFSLNFLRGLGIIFCWMSLLAALGLAAASFLSFPVAAFLSLGVLTVVLSSGTLANAVSDGTILGGNEETGKLGHSLVDKPAITVFRGMLWMINLAKNFSPIDALSTGRSITWQDLGTAFAQIVLLLGGCLALFGILVFERRELATAQGTH